MDRKKWGRTRQTGEKNGVKQNVLTGDKGVPLAVVISGANTHDIKLLEETLDGIVIFRPLPTLENPQNLCLDAGYAGSKEAVKKRGYIPHIRPRGEEKMEIERNPEFKARRLVVKVCHSWLNRFPKLLVRFEKKAENYSALVQFACALIAWRKTIRIHQSLLYFTDRHLVKLSWLTKNTFCQKYLGSYTNSGVLLSTRYTPLLQVSVYGYFPCCPLVRTRLSAPIAYRSGRSGRLMMETHQK